LPYLYAAYDFHNKHQLFSRSAFGISHGDAMGTLCGETGFL